MHRRPAGPANLNLHPPNRTANFNSQAWQGRLSPFHLAINQDNENTIMQQNPAEALFAQLQKLQTVAEASAKAYAALQHRTSAAESNLLAVQGLNSQAAQQQHAIAEQLRACQQQQAAAVQESASLSAEVAAQQAAAAAARQALALAHQQVAEGKQTISKLQQQLDHIQGHHAAELDGLQHQMQQQLHSLQAQHDCCQASHASTLLQLQQAHSRLQECEARLQVLQHPVCIDHTELPQTPDQAQEHQDMRSWQQDQSAQVAELQAQVGMLQAANANLLSDKEALQHQLLVHKHEMAKLTLQLGVAVTEQQHLQLQLKELRPPQLINQQPASHSHQRQQQQQLQLQQDQQQQEQERCHGVPQSGNGSGKHDRAYYKKKYLEMKHIYGRLLQKLQQAKQRGLQLQLSQPHSRYSKQPADRSRDEPLSTAECDIIPFSACGSISDAEHAGNQQLCSRSSNARWQVPAVAERDMAAAPAVAAAGLKRAGAKHSRSAHVESDRLLQQQLPGSPEGTVAVAKNLTVATSVPAGHMISAAIADGSIPAAAAAAAVGMCGSGGAADAGGAPPAKRQKSLEVATAQKERAGRVGSFLAGSCCSGASQGCGPTHATQVPGACDTGSKQQQPAAARWQQQQWRRKREPLQPLDCNGLLQLRCGEQCIAGIAAVAKIAADGAPSLPQAAVQLNNGAAVKAASHASNGSMPGVGGVACAGDGASNHCSSPGEVLSGRQARKSWITGIGSSRQANSGSELSASAKHPQADQPTSQQQRQSQQAAARSVVLWQKQLQQQKQQQEGSTGTDRSPAWRQARRRVHILAPSAMRTAELVRAAPDAAAAALANTGDASPPDSTAKPGKGRRLPASCSDRQMKRTGASKAEQPGAAVPAATAAADHDKINFAWQHNQQQQPRQLLQQPVAGMLQQDQLLKQPAALKPVNGGRCQQSASAPPGQQGCLQDKQQQQLQLASNIKKLQRGSTTPVALVPVAGDGEGNGRGMPALLAANAGKSVQQQQQEGARLAAARPQPPPPAHAARGQAAQPTTAGGTGSSASAAAAGPCYKYQEVVRKRTERDALPAFECEACRKFYGALASWGGPAAGLPTCGHAAPSTVRDRLPKGHSNVTAETVEAGAAAAMALPAGRAAAAAAGVGGVGQQEQPAAVRQMLQNVSRHRAKWQPPSTPTGFWDIGFTPEPPALEHWMADGFN